MATPQVNQRWPESIIARVDAQSARRGMTRTEYTLEAVESLLELEESEEAKPAPRIAARPAPSPARADAASQAAAAAEARTGVRVAKLDTSGVMVFKGGKRPAYQRSAAKGKDGR